MTARLLLLLVPMLAAACAMGMSAERFRAAHRASGVEARLVTASAGIRGELLEVRSDALVVATAGIFRKVGRDTHEIADRQLRLVPFAAIERSEFEQLGAKVQITAGRAPGADALERLRLVSRFPHGIPPSLMAQLLKAYGQTALGGIQP